MDRDEIAAVHLTWPRARILVAETYGTGDLDLGRSELKAYLRAHSMEEAVLLQTKEKNIGCKEHYFWQIRRDRFYQ